MSGADCRMVTIKTASYIVTFRRCARYEKTFMLLILFKKMAQNCANLKIEYEIMCFFIYICAVQIVVMIQELKIKNFKSFKEEVTFSFEATDDTTNDEYQVQKMPDGRRLLRFAMIYGPNAAGKSNLLNAIEFLSEFWSQRLSDSSDEIGIVPFLLDANSPSEPTEFELKFYVDDTRYWYQLVLTNKMVISERLSYYTSHQPTRIFLREYEGGQSVITFNPAVVKLSAAAKEEISLKCLPNISLFVAKSQVNVSIPEIDAVRVWQKNALLPPIWPVSRTLEYAERSMNSDANLKDYMLEFLRKADFNISGIKTEEVVRTLPDKVITSLLNDEDVPDDYKSMLKNNHGYTEIQSVFEHQVSNSQGEEKYILRSDAQSRGTKRILGVEAAIYTAIKNGALLSIDEVESSLHPELVEFMIQKFLENESRAQLLVTTHYDPLLNTVGDDLIRRDSVWFVEKDKAGISTLYSLDEFSGLNKISSIQKAYRNGRFGAWPVMKG